MLIISIFIILCFTVQASFQVENDCPKILRPELEGKNGTYPKWVNLHAMYNKINVTWSVIFNNSDDNPQSFIVFSKNVSANDTKWTSEILPANITYYVAKNLVLDTTYKFQVVAILDSSFRSCSGVRTSKTNGWGNKPCDCDPVGSNSTDCNIISGLCTCKNKGTMGRACDSCDKKWIKHEKLGCVKCSCPEDDRSKGTCYFDENNVQQCNCFQHFGGPTCQSCADGYYFSKPDTFNCIPCECNNNTDPAADKICDPKTGKCSSCMFNTDGPHCEFCKEGYVGSGITRNCTLLGLANPIHVESHISHSLTIIIGVCASVGFIIVLLLGVCIARRVCLRKPPMQLWTVELKDDHENVSFNSVLENPEYQNVNASLLMDDVQFYGHSTPVYQPVVEKTRMKGKFDGGGMSYHTLDSRNAET